MEKQSAKIDNSISDKTLAAIADVLALPPNDIKVQAVDGGYSRNRRSLIGCNDNWVFVKEVDVEVLPGDGQEELLWLKKDYLCTEALRHFVPELVPEWSRLEVDQHALVMAAYRPSDGWVWSPPLDSGLRHQYIQTVIDATRKLEDVQFDEATIEDLQLQPYFRDELALDDGIELIIQNEAIRNQLINKYSSYIEKKSALLRRQYEQMILLLKNEDALRGLAHKASQLIEQPNDSFGHCDVRSDNLAYHPETSQIKFVDWNWASFSTKGFGATEFLIDMARRGTDVTPWAGYLNVEMLAATVGYFTKRSLKDPLSPGNTLRDMQAESAAVAYDLYSLATGVRPL